MRSLRHSINTLIKLLLIIILFVNTRISHFIWLIFCTFLISWWRYVRLLLYKSFYKFILRYLSMEFVIFFLLNLFLPLFLFPLLLDIVECLIIFWPKIISHPSNGRSTLLSWSRTFIAFIHGLVIKFLLTVSFFIIVWRDELHILWCYAIIPVRVNHIGTTYLIKFILHISIHVVLWILAGWLTATVLHLSKISKSL